MLEYLHTQTDQLIIFPEGVLKAGSVSQFLKVQVGELYGELRMLEEGSDRMRSLRTLVGDGSLEERVLRNFARVFYLL